MAQAIDDHLDRMALGDDADRRNGYYRRRLLTERGDIERAVPRTRRFAPIEVVRAYAPRPHPTHGRLLGPNLDGPHPLRRLQSRKPQPERQHPLLLTQTF